MSDALKVVLDTQIFLRTAMNPRSACAKLAPNLWRGHYTLFITDAIEAEIKEVLNRVELRARFPQISDHVVNNILSIIQGEGNRVYPSEPIEAVSRDPKDDIFLACAKTVQADYLVSEDKDLLVLQRHHQTQIVNVATFLSILEQRQSTTPFQDE